MLLRRPGLAAAPASRTTAVASRRQWRRPATAAAARVPQARPTPMPPTPPTPLPAALASSQSSRIPCRRRRGGGGGTLLSPSITRTTTSAAAAAAAGAAATWPGGDAAAAATANPQQPQQKKDKLPMQQRVLNALLNVSNVPYSSYVPTPETPLHRVDAAIKQLWLLALYVAVARSPPLARLGMAAGIAALTVATQPPRLWRPQLLRLSAICAFIFLGAALGADGVPPLLQPRAPPGVLDGLSADAARSLAAESAYSYVVLNAGIFSVTRRSLNLALTAASLTFCALQGASLCLVTTPGEEMALALRRFLLPLRLLGVQTRRVALTLLLSLRFMSLVFEEVRNLCLGLAARGVAWREQGARGSIEIAAQMTARLFANLFERSEKIAQAMAVRGFLGPERHELYCMRANRTSVVANGVALALLGVLIWGAFFA